ncbi:hypothetical protein NTD84_13505 [Pseudomonas sp. 14P_8.1_Bac3]|uniref:hypothetical protein n=1 Tax=Pseudomonas sp. 14P_8.1_Bac3 TaxID=2971621 RepID=UPI0021CA6130|nr:hypothetical protein [Pseudomonas sp. 14P_8.1_Bac3]MCU1760730.1 hypothetical protein [Pseudomonas sp. 14P_8.1_Bac3]
MPSLNATQVHFQPKLVTHLNDLNTHTFLSESLLRVGNSPNALANLMAIVNGMSAESSDGIAPPVLHQRILSQAAPDFRDQEDVDTRWLALQKHLQTATLTEQEVLAVLGNERDILHTTNTGKAIKGLFAQAMLRSIRPVGSLDESRLKEIVDVICDLPRAQWQSALGENVRFPSGQENPQGVTGFIQAQLDRSSALRDKRIENFELISDQQWQTLKTLAEKGQDYIRKSDGDVYRAMMKLDEEPQMQPSPQEAHARLEAFIDQLEQGTVKRARWPERYLTEVKALRDKVDPHEGAAPSAWDWLDGPSWLEGLRAHPSSEPVNATPTATSVASSDDGATWLLEELEAFERSTDFYTHVATGDAGIPEGVFARFLWACNVLKTFNLLELDHSHITTGPGPKPSGEAWKNGTTDFYRLPIGPDAAGAQSLLETNPLVLLEQLVTQADDLFTQITRKVLPWDSASATDEVIEMLPPVYRSTTEVDPTTFAAQAEVVREQMGSLLTRMSSYLVGAGAAALGRAGELIVENPVKATGLVGLYLALQQLCAHVFLPEPEPLVDPLQGLLSDPETVRDEASVAYDNIMLGIQELFDDLPTFAEDVERLVSQSDELDPVDDPLVLAGIEILLKKVVPDNTQNVTYRDYVSDTLQSALVDALDEFMDEPDGSATDPDDVRPSEMLTSDESASHRNSRSLLNSAGLSSNVQISEDGEADHSLARLVIQAGQQAADARIALQSAEEIAPGVPIQHVADRFIEAFTATQKLSDPLQFMSSVVEHAIEKSGLPKNITSTLTPETRFTVEYDSPRPVASKGNFYPIHKYRYQGFTLLELFAGQHERAAKSREDIKILWPAGYTADFKKTVTDNDFPEEFEKKAKEVLAQPAAANLWKANKKLELKQLIKNYSRSGNATATGKTVASSFLDGNIQARAISIANGPLSGLDHVANAVYVHPENSTVGLFVFLGGEGKVIECPLDLFKEGGRSIEEFPELRNELSKRIPIKALLSRGEDDFKYSQGIFDLKDLHWSDIFKPLIPTLIGNVDKLKTPYWPIVMGRADGADFDLFDELHHRQSVKMMSDIDTLTSTKGERIADFLLELMSDSLAAASCILAVPEAGAVAKALALLFGIGSSATEYARSLVDDDPQQADRHKANGIRGAVFELAAPFAGKLLGKGISYAMKKRLAGTILERLKSLGHLPPGIVKHLPKFDMPKLAVNMAKGTRKWIPPKVQDLQWTNKKLLARFKNYQVIRRLNNLEQGPHIAQKLMDRTGLVIYRGKKAGYVYKGFVMRGDMRAPDEVFREGFKLRAPVTDVKQVNGMNGGFGGGKNALDPDGMGVSTSAFYSDGGVGAYHYGGGKGGYTYLVDARDMIGFDLYRNRNFDSIKPERIGFKPVEINFGNDIPGSRIVGAYGPNGEFIRNDRAIARSIRNSEPNPLQPPLPFKKYVKETNATIASTLSPGCPY